MGSSCIIRQTSMSSQCICHAACFAALSPCKHIFEMHMVIGLSLVAMSTNCRWFVSGCYVHKCCCHVGFGGVFCEGTQQAQVLGQQIHGYVDPGQWSYFSLTLRRSDPSWQGGVAVAFLTTGGGYPVVLQKYSSVPSLLNNDRVLRYCSMP